MSTTLVTALGTNHSREVAAVQAARWKGDSVSVAPGVAMLPLSVVNVYFVGEPTAGDRGWVLVDTGLGLSAHWIKRAAIARFGAHARPSAIVLTHGHFDHVGSAATLARQWQCPVFIHEHEVPFVTGRAAYPPPDPGVGGGLMSRLSWMFPRGPANLAGHLRSLPTDGSVPPLPGWQWIPTPGHSPGHVSLFREKDGVLIAGDAFVTQVQESVSGVLTMSPGVRRPPAYYTTDWAAARSSVERLRDLRPNIAMTGHGVPVYGQWLQKGLEALLENWERSAVPANGHYVRHPLSGAEAALGDGSMPSSHRGLYIAAGVGIAAGLLAMGALARRRD